VQGRADLALAPDEPTGFSMTLLRLLAFEPVTEGTQETKSAAPGGREPARRSASPEASVVRDAPRPTVTSAASAPTPIANGSETAPGEVAAASPGEKALPAPAEWPAFVAGMNLSGIALQLAAQTELKTITGTEFVLAVPESARHLTDKPYADKLKAALEQTLGRRVRLRFEMGQIADTTLAAQEKREREAARASTEAAFRDDPFVQDVLSRFDARIKPNSIKPV
jgi:DNA polymerase-3 subunit gamma/tau